MVYLAPWTGQKNGKDVTLVCWRTGSVGGLVLNYSLIPMRIIIRFRREDGMML